MIVIASLTLKRRITVVGHNVKIGLSDSEFGGQTLLTRETQRAQRGNALSSLCPSVSLW